MTALRFQVIGDVYRLNAERFGDKPAFVMPDGRVRSFVELYRRITTGYISLKRNG